MNLDSFCQFILFVPLNICSLLSNTAVYVGQPVSLHIKELLMP